MNSTLQGKRAIVTGSSDGIGFAIARALAGAGAAVVLNGRNPERLKAAISRLQSEVPHAGVVGVAADVGDPSALSRFVAAIPEIDILVNNASPIETKPFFEIPDEDWERFFHTVVMGPVRLSRHYVRGMVARHWGRVLFSSSVTGGFMQGEMVHYGTMKAALLGLSRGLAEQVAGTGVTVNAFIPGPTHTRESFMLRASSRFPGKTFEEIEKELFDGPLPTSLLKRFINPAELASFVLFLASKESSAITGSALHVDGGIIRTLL
jgi:NAD(P)-dependent dehydrogenase (short-subunit alcohol dehydrogenase family)